jgi:hypothetical protein
MKAEKLAQANPRERAYLGFVMVKHDLIGTRCEPCVLLTDDGARQVNGVVRIHCTLRCIQDISVSRNEGMQITRGDYAGE